MWREVGGFEEAKGEEGKEVKKGSGRYVWMARGIRKLAIADGAEVISG